MFRWEQARERARRSLVVEDALAPEQVNRLSTYRTTLSARAVDIELGLDERRLRFARWLYEHGRISDFRMTASDIVVE
jgi:hypothetical protein